MKEDNFVNYSNRKPTKSQNLLSKGRNLISQLQNRSASPIKQGISPRFFNKFVVNAPKLEGYRDNTSIILTDERIRQINRKLEIAKETQLNFDHRMKTQNMYIQSMNNPITQEFKQENSNYTQKKYQNQQKRHLLSEMLRIKDNNITVSTIKTRMSYLPTPAKNLCVKLGKENQNISLRYGQNDEPIAKISQKKIKSDTITRNTELDWLQKLKNVKEDSYFHLNNKDPKNIFSILIDENHADFLSNKQILNKFHFDLTSIVLTKSEGKYFHQDISQISSQARKDIYIEDDKLQQTIVRQGGAINMDELQFSDIMLIASGKVNKINMHRYFNEEEMEAKRLEQEAQEEIIEKLRSNKQVIEHSKNVTNRGDNFYPDFQSKAEIDYYRMTKFNNMERQQLKICHNFANKFRELIQQEIFVRSNRILDKSLLNNLRIVMDKTLIDMLEQGSDNSEIMFKKNVDRKIRHNKSKKNRTQKLKINEVTKTLKMKKEFISVNGQFTSRSSHKTSSWL